MVEVRLTSQEIILYIYLSIPTSIIEAKQILYTILLIPIKLSLLSFIMFIECENKIT